jgi:hypothetical protein
MRLGPGVPDTLVVSQDPCLAKLQKPLSSDTPGLTTVGSLILLDATGSWLLLAITTPTCCNAAMNNCNVTVQMLPATCMGKGCMARAFVSPDLLRSAATLLCCSSKVPGITHLSCCLLGCEAPSW